MAVLMTSVDMGPRWERLHTRAFALLPYALLAVSVGITLGVDGLTGASVITVAWSAGAGAWMLLMFSLRTEQSRPNAVSIVYFVGLLGCNALLIMRAPWYGAFAFAAYLHAFESLPGLWAFGGISLNAVLSAIAQLGGQPEKTGVAPVFYVVMIVVNVVLAGGFSYYGRTSQQQNQTRKKIIAELEQTNRRLAAALAENAGLHEQLLTQAREAGVLDERQRMAREIHDTIAQGLTGIITQLEAAAQASGSEPDWRRHHANAIALARESLSEARRSVRAVQPEPLAAARLPEALATVVQRWSDINAVPVELTTTGTARPMHPELEVTLLRTAQEALANVAKHAAAGRVGLTLSYMEDMVTLDVRDDGVGFEPAGVDSEPVEPREDAGGFGLTSMRQRVHRLHGSLEIESAPGAGTAISASVPAIAVGAEPVTR